MSPRQKSPLTIEHVLLALLDHKPLYGYELYQKLCRLNGISQIWNVKQPMLYALLEKMEERGYISSQVHEEETYPPRKYFYLTEMGRRSLTEWMNTPVRRVRDFRQEFLAKLIIAYWYGKDDAFELMANQEKACQAWYAEMQDHIPPHDADHVDEWMIYSFRINQVEAELTWLHTLRADFEQLLP